MPVQGRPKGSKAEIEIAKKLKAWWSPFEPAEFVRTPLSGGWGGKDLRAGFRASGDVMTTAEKFPFTVEVKRREGWAWSTLLAGRASPIWGYWAQAVGQAKEQGGIPLMFFRKNREAWFLMLPHLALVGSKVSLAPNDYAMAWFAGSLIPYSAGVHPVVITAESFFRTAPRVWTLVAPTFPRK